MVVADGWQRVQPLVFPVIDVSTLHLAPYHVRRPGHAALLHASGKGFIGNKPFHIARRQELSVSLPVEWLSSFLRYPLSHIKSGAARVLVRLSQDGPGKWEAVAQLSVAGDKRLDSSGVADVATQQVLAYMDATSLNLAAKTTLDADAEDEERFVSQLATQFSVVILKQAGIKLLQTETAGMLGSWLGLAPAQKETAKE